MADLEEVGRTIEALTGVPPRLHHTARPMSRKERQDQAGRVRRFRALSPELQEGALRYAERIRASYQA